MVDIHRGYILISNYEEKRKYLDSLVDLNVKVIFSQEGFLGHGKSMKQRVLKRLSPVEKDSLKEVFSSRGSKN